jgi:hypothetical protein
MKKIVDFMFKSEVIKEGSYSTYIKLKGMFFSHKLFSILAVNVLQHKSYIDFLLY